MTTPNNEEALINAVKSRPLLWNCKDPEYKNISLKTEEFSNIGRSLNLTGDEVRRKWRSLRSGFRRELLARSNKKPKPKIKKWKHFNKLLFLRDSENALSDNEFDDNQQNNSMCVNQSDNVSTDDFSDLMQLNSPVPNLVETMVENGELKLNLITNDKQDKQCQEDNTQIKILQPNITHNSTIQPHQIYFVKTNGVSDIANISNLLLIKKTDQATTATTTTTTQQQLNVQDEFHQQHNDQQNIPKAITTTTQTNHRTNEQMIINSYKTTNNSNNTNVQTSKTTKKRKDEIDEDLDANDYFGRMIASLIKEFDQDERKSIRLAILQLVTDWSKKKNHHDNI